MNKLKFSLSSHTATVLIILCIFNSLNENKCETTIEEEEEGKPPSSAVSGRAAFSSEPNNVKKIFNRTIGNNETGRSEMLVTVNIPENLPSKTYFPNLRFINDSTEINERDETIAGNSTTMISGVATRFGKRKRSVRSYHLYQHQQNYPSRFSSSGMAPSSSYSGRYYMDRYPYRYDHNGIDRVSDGSSSSWGGSWLNKLKKRTNMMMNPGMQTMDRNQMNNMMMMNMMNEGESIGTAEEPDTAGTFISGWGPLYNKSKVNKSAVGLLGFLSILSLIQNVLNQTMPMPMGGGRKRRNVRDEVKLGDELSDFADGVNWDMDQLDRNTALVVTLVLPMANAVNLAQNGEIDGHCTLLPICSGNQLLVEKFKEKGREIGMVLSEELSKLLVKKSNNRWKISDVDIKGRVIRAGMAGRNGKSCSDMYKECLDISIKTHYPISSKLTEYLMN